MTHTFHHPKHYKEMRAKRRKLQAASDKPYQINYDDFCKGDEEEASSSKPQAASFKPQAPSDSSSKQQASSPKQQASSSEGSSEDLRSSKPQATSSMIREPRNI